MMKLLIPLDGSPGELRAVNYVISHLEIYKTMPQLLLLNVQWKVATANVKLFIDQTTINDYYLEQGMAALQPARDVLKTAGLAYEYHISVGPPAESISRYAHEQGVDQIIMCREGQGGLQNFLLGSVLAKVLQQTDCPVLLVK